MLTAVKNQLRISIMSIKYALIREMLNKVTFLTNIIFMILNNASFILQWLIFFSLKDNFGGYSFNQVLLLWGIASGTYGVSHFFFKNAYKLSDFVNTGKLDSFLVQPKNVLISIITSDISTSAIGDMLYGLIILFIASKSILGGLLYFLFCITGGLIITSFVIIIGSLSFWFGKSDVLSETLVMSSISFSTYPDGIFKGIIKSLLYIIVPVGFVAYLPIKIITSFKLILFLAIILVTILFILLAFYIFNKGLKRYSSSNLMIARI